jgi:hypothetical protein
MTKTKELCRGCYDDYYNQNREEGCWSFKTAKVVKRVRVGIWQQPPYTWRPETVLSCYRAQGCAMLPRDDCRVRMPSKAKQGTKS